MKARVIIISAAVLAGCLILYFALTFGKEPGPQKFDVTQWDSYSENQLTRSLNAMATARALPVGQEKEFLSWLFTKHPDEATKFIDAHSLEIDQLPWFMSDTAWDLIRTKQPETGLKILGLARKLFPNDPDVLGFQGIVAYLQGNKTAARSFLEEAETWRRNRPVVEFYLGGLLIMSEQAADRTRGKTILMDLVRGGDAEMRELSGLTLLSNTSVPLLPEDMDLIYKTLTQDKVFRLNNSNLPIEVMRVITTRMIGKFPEEAMHVADLLMQYPNVTTDDYLNMIRFAQVLGKKDVAAKYLDLLQKDPKLSEGLENDVRLERLLTAQCFLEERYDEGLERLQALVRNPDLDVQAIQETFQAAMKSKPPMSTEEKLLDTYLEVPVQHLKTSMTVVTRLIQINPLGREKYISYAIKNLLDLDPGLVGSWLTELDASKEIILAVKQAEPNLSGDQYIVLVGAYLKEQDPDQAQAALTEAGGRVDPALSNFLQARIYLQKGDQEKASEAWNEAYQLVSKSTRFPLMKSLGFLALDLKQPVNAMRLLYTARTAGIPFSQEQANTLISLILSYGTLRQAIQVAEYLATAYPDDPVNKNNLAYFRFLADESIDESVEVMRKLVEAYPDVHQYSLTLALGLVKAGRTNEASRLLKTTHIDWNTTSNRGRLIYAVVLAASDQRVVAEGLIQNIDMSQLIPEEKALLEKF